MSVVTQDELRRTPTADAVSAGAACRGCGATLRGEDVFADLGTAPLANALLFEDQLDQPEVHYPLRVVVCRKCLLVQLPAAAGYQTGADPALLFPASYPFRSGASMTWGSHCRNFADLAVERFNLGPLSSVLEIGSNDGVGLRRFRSLGIPAMGVEPCRDVATEALYEGIATAIEWWSADYARTLRNSGYKANLVIARNVLAHVPDLRDFLLGVKTVLAPGGTAVFEVPYVGHLVAGRRWDQIYHEHHCYFSLGSLNFALRGAGLVMTDVEHIETHGGSVRVYAQEQPLEPSKGSARDALLHEIKIGLQDFDTYTNFAKTPPQAKLQIQAVLASRLRELPTVGYGASAKAVTMLNYCGIGPETISAMVDITPAKWGMYLPGSHIPVRMPPYLANAQPEVVVNFCWNWRKESEERIHEACPDAEILYLQDMQS